MRRTVIAALGVVMTLGVIASARTIVWGSEGVDMGFADAAWAYCKQEDPEAPYPQEGHDLSACEEWWNDGDPLPSGGG
jgi:hypothetical protein